MLERKGSDPVTTKITRRQAAHVSITAQLLSNNRRAKATRDDVRRLVERLACIQIDTIHVVARSQYIILWSRLGDYDPAWLDALYYPERGMFEYWAHAASLIDTSLLPCFLSRMDDNRERFSPTHHTWASENQETIAHVRRRIADEGPLSSLDFERPNPDVPVEPWAWWGGKPANRAMDLLWTTGELAVRRRVNFRREYDLFDRVHPEIVEMVRPDPPTERRILTDRALQAMGIVRPAWLNDYFRTKWGNRNNHPPGPEELLRSLVAAGRAIPVEIEGLGDAYVSIDQESRLADVQRGYVPTRTTLLSPFDNLIWDRCRTLELLDFDYRLECYTPESKRIYGYFSLPILRRGRLVGRLDPKIERKTGEFFVNSLHLEPGVRVSNRLIEDIRSAVHAFARWNGASEVCSKHAPAEIAEAIDGTLNG